jgi:hypothetical protein
LLDLRQRQKLCNGLPLPRSFIQKQVGSEPVGRVGLTLCQLGLLGLLFVVVVGDGQFLLFLFVLGRVNRGIAGGKLSI